MRMRSIVKAYGDPDGTYDRRTLTQGRGVNLQVDACGASTHDRQCELDGSPSHHRSREMNLPSGAMLRRDEAEVRLTDARAGNRSRRLVDPSDNPGRIQHVDRETESVQRLTQLRTEDAQGWIAAVVALYGRSISHGGLCSPPICDAGASPLTCGVEPRVDRGSSGLPGKNDLA
jgi:hypothetical protein